MGKSIAKPYLKERFDALSDEELKTYQFSLQMRLIKAIHDPFFFQVKKHLGIYDLIGAKKTFINIRQCLPMIHVKEDSQLSGLPKFYKEIISWLIDASELCNHDESESNFQKICKNFEIMKQDFMRNIEGIQECANFHAHIIKGTKSAGRVNKPIKVSNKLRCNFWKQTIIQCTAQVSNATVIIPVAARYC